MIITKIECRAAASKEAHDIGVAVHRCAHERSPGAVRGEVGVSPQVEKQGANVEVAVYGGATQSGVAVHRWVWLGARGDQSTNDGVVAALGSHGERRPPVWVNLVGIGTAAEQGFELCETA